MMRILLLVLTALLPTVTAHAEVRTYHLERGTVQFDVPSDWQDARDLFGIPLTLLAPKAGDRRPVIGVIVIGYAGWGHAGWRQGGTGQAGKPGLGFDAKALEKDQAGYRAGREAWLKKRGGRALAFFPYSELKWTGAEEVHSIGYRYALGKASISERTFYVVCGGRLFQLQATQSASHEKETTPLLDQVLRSFRCE